MLFSEFSFNLVLSFKILFTKYWINDINIMLATLLAKILGRYTKHEH